MNNIIGSITHRNNVIDKEKVLLLRHEKIKCANCRADLLEVIQTKEDKEKVTATKVRCPHCNDSSFWFKTSGELRFQTPDNLAIINVETNIRNGITYNNFTVDII